MLTDARKAVLLAYCHLEPDEIAPELLQRHYDEAVGYLETGGVRAPMEGTPRRAQYDGLIDALVLDAIDHPGAQMGANLQENRAFRRKLNQMKHSEPVPDLGTGLGVW